MTHDRYKLVLKLSGEWAHTEESNDLQKLKDQASAWTAERKTAELFKWVGSRNMFVPIQSWELADLLLEERMLASQQQRTSDFLKSAMEGEL